jgi:hypothetical protein
VTVRLGAEQRIVRALRYSHPPSQVKATSLQSLPCADLTGRVLAGIEAVLLADAKLVGKKSLYIRLGARGDWPDLAPPSGSE